MENLGAKVDEYFAKTMVCAIMAVVVYFVFVVGATKLLSHVFDGVPFWPDTWWFHPFFLFFLTVGFLVGDAKPNFIYNDKPYRSKIEVASKFYQSCAIAFVANLFVGAVLVLIIKALFYDSMWGQKHMVGIMTWTWRLTLCGLVFLIYKKINLKEFFGWD